MFPESESPITVSWILAFFSFFRGFFILALLAHTSSESPVSRAWHFAAVVSLLFLLWFYIPPLLAHTSAAYFELRSRHMPFLGLHPRSVVEGGLLPSNKVK